MRAFQWFGVGVIIVLVLVMLFGCASFLEMADGCDPHFTLLPCRPASQSWDQENLKRHDSGCPTAIYIAPNGVLEQCP